MGGNLSIYKKRNVLIVKLLWFSYILGIASNFLAQVPIDGIIAFTIIGLVIVIFITFLTFGKLSWAPFVQYAVAVNFPILIFFMVSTSPKLSNYMMIYVAIAFVTMYHNSKSIALSAVLGLGLSNYFFVAYQQEMFYGAGYDILVSLNIMFFIITAALIAQAKIGENMQLDMDKHYQETLKGKEQVEKLLQEVNSSIHIITTFSENLKENITSTERISNELTQSYGEMAKGVESSASSVADIHQSVHKTSEDIHNVESSVHKMNQRSSETTKATKEGEKRIEELNKQMYDVGGIIDNQSTIVSELYSQSKEIGSILSSIAEISDQTNLLALNASIEAARAGEHGKGFAVVAEEVRKLAENSQSSTSQISKILKDIHEKVEVVKNQVDASKLSVEKSLIATDATKTQFTTIEQYAEESTQQSKEVSERVKEINAASDNVLKELNHVTSYSEQSSATVEEMLASVEEQNERIGAVVNSFGELEELTSKLRRLVQ